METRKAEAVKIYRPNQWRLYPYTWDRGKPTATPGFLLTTRGRQTHLTEAEAVNLANQIIDQIEETHIGGNTNE